MNNPACTRRPRGFTLVELLVVIGVIAVLISILLPSLAKATAASRTVACQNNLRQIAMWGIMYAGDNKGVLPTHDDKGDGNSWRSPDPTNPGQYIGEFWHSKAPAQIYRGWGTRSGSPMHCPEAVNAVEPLRTNSSGVLNIRGINYGLNAYLGGRKDWGGSGFAPKPTTRMLTSQTFWFADGRAAWFSPGWDFHPVLQLNSQTPGTSWPWPWTTTISTFIGHPQKTCNFAFGDGHVEAISEKEFRALPAARFKKFVGNPF